MNIFKILSRGDGTIKEPNITSVLSYLLDPKDDHGMGPLLLMEFLEKIVNTKTKNETIKNNIKIIKSSYENNDQNIDVNIDIEKKIIKDDNSISRDLDIYLDIKKSDDLILRLIIEIKIYKESLKFKKSGTDEIYDQLEDIVEISQNISPEDDDKTVYILLAPDEINFKPLSNSKSERFMFAKWYCHKFSDSKLNILENTIYSIFQNILLNESKGEISPLNPQLKDLIKSFMVFIFNGFRDKQNLNPSITNITIQFSNNKSLEFKNKKATNKTKNDTSINDVQLFVFSIIEQIYENLNPPNKIGQMKQILEEVNSSHKKLKKFTENLDIYIDFYNKKTNPNQKIRVKLLMFNEEKIKREVVESSSTPLEKNKIINNNDEDKYIFITTEMGAGGSSNFLLHFIESISHLQLLKQIITKVEYTSEINIGKSESFSETKVLKNYNNDL